MAEGPLPLATRQLSPLEAAAVDRAKIYAMGMDLEQLMDAGLIKLHPQGYRILMRAIKKEDALATSLFRAAMDARDAVAHEIIAIGPACSKYWKDNGVPEDDWLKPGQHLFVLSTAADRISKTDNTVRLWSVHVEDVINRIEIIEQAAG